METRLAVADFMNLEEYEKVRDEKVRAIIAHKKNRRIMLGQHICLLFEDVRTIMFQIQEMLRIEKIVDPELIKEELCVYDSLIPTGKNHTVTLLIQYEDVEKRRDMLTKLVGVEERIWLQVGSCEKIFPIADEDLNRTEENKTSAVHFLRFEYSDAQITQLREEKKILCGSSHEMLTVSQEVDAGVVQSLTRDFV